VVVVDAAVVVIAAVVVVIGGSVVVGDSEVVGVGTATVDGVVVCALVEATETADAAERDFELEPHPPIATATRNEARSLMAMERELSFAIENPPGTASTSHF
jgi:hypothetical protein